MLTIHQVIQGDTDVAGKLSQQEVAKTLDFCFHSLAGENGSSVEYKSGGNGVDEALSPGQIRLLDTIRSRWEEYRETSAGESLHARLTRIADENVNQGTDEFGADVINGLTPRLQRGSLGLTVASGEAHLEVGTSQSVGNLNGHKELSPAVTVLQ